MSADVAYLDTSAVVKLLVREPESLALRHALRQWPRRASSALLRVELLRVTRRAGHSPLTALAHRQLGTIHLVRLDDRVLDRAAELDPPALRSLDALHLATALELGGDLGAIITYDERMVQGAAALGLTATSPR